MRVVGQILCYLPAEKIMLEKNLQAATKCFLVTTLKFRSLSIDADGIFIFNLGIMIMCDMMLRSKDV